MKFKHHQVDPIDFGQKLLLWKRKGFRELGDYAGMGIGATTDKVLSHKEYTTDPKAVSAEL